jgi:hypothetical protein
LELLDRDMMVGYELLKPLIVLRISSLSEAICERLCSFSEYPEGLLDVEVDLYSVFCWDALITAPVLSDVALEIILAVA